MEGMKSDRYLGIYVLYPVPYNGSPTVDNQIDLCHVTFFLSYNRKIFAR